MSEKIDAALKLTKNLMKIRTEKEIVAADKALSEAREKYVEIKSRILAGRNLDDVFGVRILDKFPLARMQYQMHNEYLKHLGLNGIREYLSNIRAENYYVGGIITTGFMFDLIEFKNDNRISVRFSSRAMNHDFWEDYQLSELLSEEEAEEYKNLSAAYLNVMARERELNTVRNKRNNIENLLLYVETDLLAAEIGSDQIVGNIQSLIEKYEGDVLIGTSSPSMLPF